MTTHIRLSATVLALGTALLGASVGMSIQARSDAHADITVMPCSAWANTQNPKVPAFTFTGACELPDGHLSTP